jgi:hypothetical protein
MKKWILAIVLFVLFSSISQAKYTQTCKVKYKKNYGWSEYYTVDVNFMSGTELNRATRSYSYDSFSTYAVIFWDKDEVTMVKISSYLSCGNEVSQRCISNAITSLEGEDQQGRGWEICTKSFCY